MGILVGLKVQLTDGPQSCLFSRTGCQFPYRTTNWIGCHTGGGASGETVSGVAISIAMVAVIKILMTLLVGSKVQLSVGPQNQHFGGTGHQFFGGTTSRIG